MVHNELADAISHGDVTRVTALLRSGTLVNPASGTTPLYRAAVRGQHDIVRLLLEYGADPDQPSGGEHEGLPLCAAACWDHAQTVHELITGGADPNAREHDGWTALLWAAANGCLASADILLDAGADPDAASDDSETPLTLAAAFGSYGIVWSLLEHGADPTRPGLGGMTALEIATRWSALGPDELPAALRAEVAAESATGPYALITTMCHAPDGTRLVTVRARGPSGHTVSRQCGHVAIMTCLEAALGIRPPVRDLLRRALPYRDTDAGDETWCAAVQAVRRRHDDATFETVVRLCASDDPVEREFGADVLAEFGLDPDRDPYHDRVLPVLREMARREEDPRVLEAVLHALGCQADQRALPDVLEIVNRPGRTPTINDPIALAAVLPPDDDDGLSALVRLSESPDDEVRDWATIGIAGLPVDTPPIRRALADRLGDRDLCTAAEAAYGLATRADRRALDGIHRVLQHAGEEQDYARDLALQAARELGLEISEA